MAITIQGFGEVETLATKNIISAQVNDVNQLAQSKVYQISDRDNALSPFDAGVLTSWRGRGVTETRSGKVIFDGTIQDISKTGDLLELRVEEPLVTYLNFSVDASMPAGTLKTSGAYIKGATVVNLSDASNVLVYARVIFAGSENEYLITKVNNNTITFEPALYRNVDDNADAYIYNPSIVTGANALKNALIATRLADKLGTSFDYYDALDASLNNLLYLNIRPIDNYSLKNFITKICELCCFDFFTSRSGRLEIRRFGDSSGVRELEITESELIPEIVQSFNASKLFYRYDIFFHAGVDSLELASGEVDAATISAWDNIEAFRPVSSKGFREQKIIYNNENFARQMGDLVLSTKAAGKYQIKAALKKTPHNSTAEYNLNLFDAFRVTLNAVTRTMRVTGYEYDETQDKYTSIILEEV